MRSSRYDVVVVGGGPAGALTAYHLARAGARIAVIDAARFPRCKPCGGGLQVRAIQSIPFDISHLFRGVMREIKLLFRLSAPETRCYAEPLVYNVLRTEFDLYLLTQAEAAGADIYEESVLRSLD